MSDLIIQKLPKKEFEKPIDKAINYYSILSAFYQMKLQRREIELLAFTAVRGTITPLPARNEFVAQFKTSLATIENIKGKLIKMGLLIKDGEMYRVNPAIAPQFDKPITLQINLI